MDKISQKPKMYIERKIIKIMSRVSANMNVNFTIILYIITFYFLRLDFVNAATPSFVTASVENFFDWKHVWGHDHCLIKKLEITRRKI